MAYKKSDFRAEYFERELKKYLAEDKIAVNFDGFNEVVAGYFDHEEYLIDELHELIADINLWTAYLGGFYGILTLKIESYILDKDILLSQKDRKNENEQLLQDIQQLTNRIKQIKLIQKSVIKSLKFFNVAFWKCRGTLKASIRTLVYKSHNY